MWKNTVVPDRPQKTIWRMRIACWIRNATNIVKSVQYLLLFHCSSGCTNALHCYVVRALSVGFLYPRRSVFTARYEPNLCIP